LIAQEKEEDPVMAQINGTVAEIETAQDHPRNTQSSLTGFWVVRREFTCRGARHMGVIHLDSVIRGAHLLDVYTSFYVNKYIDHHAFELVF
jgi:hypothetical protein